MEPRAANTWNLLLGRPRCMKGNSHRPGTRTQLGRVGQGRQIQVGRESCTLTLQADVLNFTFPFIYFFFLNPVSFPEASNLLFNIGLCD